MDNFLFAEILRKTQADAFRFCVSSTENCRGDKCSPLLFLHIYLLLLNIGRTQFAPTYVWFNCHSERSEESHGLHSIAADGRLIKR